MRLFNTTSWLYLLVVGLLGQTAVSAQTIQLVSAPGKFYVDDKSDAGIVYNYAAYTISNNTGVTFPSVYVAITNMISTNRVVLASTDSGVRALGALAPGQVKMAAFYLKGPSFTGNSDSLTGLTNENHTIRVLNGPPGVGSILVSSNYGFTNISFVVEALANKITIITNLNPHAVLGSQVVLIIGGDTGTIGGQNSMFFSPAVLSSWRPDCYELTGTVLTFTRNPNFTNRMYVDPSVPGFTNFAGQSYTNTFYFRAVKPTGTNIAVSPFSFIDSGSGTKHTAVSSLVSAGGTNIIVGATNAVAIVGQTVSPNSLNTPGGAVTYSITFSNYGPIDTALDDIVNTLASSPANVTYIPGSATFNSAPLSDPTIVGQNLHWAIPVILPSNSVSVLTFQANAPWPPGQYTNSIIALLGSSQIDATLDTFDNSPSRSVLTVVPVADVAIGKTGPASIVAASTFSYTLNVTNFGPSPSTDLTVTDSLPANVTFVSASSGGTFNGTQVVWTNLSIASNSVATFTIIVTAPADATSLTNTAAASSPILDPNLANNSTPPVLTTVTASADLGAGKSGPASINSGVNFNYTISVTNFGPSIASNVSVVDQLPTGVTFVSASAGGVLSGQQVTWANLGMLAAGSSTNLVLTVTAPVNGASLTNTASASSTTTDPNSTNNVTPPVTTSVTPVADVAVSKSAPANVSISDNFAYTISVTNIGPSLATNLSVTDSLPVGVTFVSASGGGFLNGNQVLWTNLNLAAGSATNFTLTVTAPGVTSTLTNIATGSSATADPMLANNSSGEIITVVGASADLAIRKSSPASVNAAQNFDYTITVTNVGPTESSSVTVTDDLPLDVTFVSASAGGVWNGTQVVWTNLGNMATGASTNLIVTVLAPADGTTLTNIASVTSPTPDPVATNNVTPPVITVVNSISDLSIAKIALSSNPLPGAQFNYTILVSNIGPSVASSITVTDSLPANLTFVGASGGGQLAGSDVIWTNLGTLAAGAFTNLTLTVQAPLSGTVTNTASVGGGTVDPNSTNNFTPPVTTTISNLPPVAVDDVASTLKNTSISVSVLENDSDPNGDLLTITGVNSTNGSAVISGTNVVFTPATNFSGTATIGYTISDGNGGTSSAVITVTVNNSIPVANDDVYTISEDFTFTVAAGGILTNDIDGDGDTLAAMLVANVTNGVLSLNLDGSFDYTPSTNFNGVDHFSYRATDGLATSAVATVTINVTPVNDGPTAGNQFVTTPEDMGTNLVLIGDDVESVVTFAILSGPTNGVISGFNTNTGALVYTPNTNYNGPDSIAFTVSDGSLLATGIVSITITPVNDGPVANNQNATTPEDTSTNLVFGGTDPESVVTFAILSGPTNGVVNGFNPNSGILTYTPNTNFNGVDTIVFTVTDGSLIATGIVSITVTPVNDAPIANPDNYSLLKNTTLIVPVSGVLTNDTDVENSLLTASLLNNVSHGTLNLLGDGSFTYTPSNNYVGPDSFTYEANDGTTNSSVTLVSLGILPTNSAPVANNQDITTPEDTATNLVLTASDGDGDPLTFSIVSGPTNGVLNGFNATNGTVAYLPNTNFNGSDSFTFQVNDGATNSGIATVSITVTPINDAPIANNQNVTTPEDTVTNIVLVGSDVESAVTFAILSAPTNGVISGFNPNTGALAYTPNTNFNGVDTIVFTVTDGSLLATGIVSITVTPINDAPIANNQSVTTPEDVSTNIVLSGTDIESVLTFAILSGPTNGIASGFNSNTGELLYTPDTNFNGVDRIVFTVTDGSLLATGIVNIAVTPVNDAPIANDDSATTPEDTAVTIPVLTNDSDPDGDSVTITGAVATNGTVSIVGTNLVFLPATNFNGVASIDYSIADGNGGTDSAFVSVNVTAQADVALFKSGPTTIVSGGTITYTILLTNSGPSIAMNVVVTDQLPTNLTFQSASSGGSFSGGEVTWGGIALAPSGFTNYTVVATAPTNGSFTNIASASSTTFDPVPSNNNGSANGSRVATSVAVTEFGILQGSIVFNPQTGLFEQRVTVTNTSAATISAMRLYVDGLRTGVSLWNATGSETGRPYVQYNSPLNPNQTVMLRLEFYVPDRRPFTNTLEAVAVLPATTGTNAATGVSIDRMFVDSRIVDDPRYVIEFVSIPGRVYTVIYSDDGLSTWQAATPSVTASVNRTQWYDDGPPKTVSKPLSNGSRFYRVILAPANP